MTTLLEPEKGSTQGMRAVFTRCADPFFTPATQAKQAKLEPAAAPANNLTPPMLWDNTFTDQEMELRYLIRSQQVRDPPLICCPPHRAH